MLTTPLAYLGWTLALALFQILLAAGFKRQQDGLQWAAGNRDGAAKEYHGTAARLARAQANLFETFPIFVGAVLLAHVSSRAGGWAAWGAGLYFWARLAYVPAYALGLGPVRTIIWGVSVVGLVLVLLDLLA